MGVVRILLAIAVVLGHVGGIYNFKYIDGVIAVQSFFIISGFYMSLILNEKYVTKSDYKLFISNRLLRLFPTYFFVIIATFSAILFYHFYLKNPQPFLLNFKNLTSSSKIFVLITNVVIIGQDIALFLGLKNGTLYFTSNFMKSQLPVYTFMLCAPAWSLSLELLFYILAPFIVRRKIYLVLLILTISFIFRIILSLKGLNYDPWTYRFFPTELAFFLLGTVAYKIYVEIKKRQVNIQIGRTLLVLVLILLFSFNYIPIQYYIKQYIFYFLFFLSIPFVFISFKKNNTDRIVGELSYPIYLSHIFVLEFVMPIVNEKIQLGMHSNLIFIILTVLFSIVLIQLLINPIDRYRAKRFQRLHGGQI